MQDFGTLGRLVVSLEANMASFEAGLNKAEYQMQQFGQRIDTLTAGATKALLGLAATAAAAFSFDAIVGGVEKAIGAAAELEKMSQKAGVSAEALSGLKSVGKLTGTALEEIVGSLQKLDKAMIQAESGSQKQAATFKALGVSMADLKNLTPDEVMLKVAKSLDQVESGSVRVAAAQILFGRTGANLLPMLRDLAEQGEIVGKITDQQAAMAEKYERALIALDSRKKSLYNTIAMALLPTMIDFVDAFSKADSIVGRLDKTAKGLSADNSLLEWSRSVAMGVARVIDVFDGVGRVISLAGNGLARFMADMKVMLDFGSGIGGTLIKQGPDAVAARWNEMQIKLASNQQTASDNAFAIAGAPWMTENLLEQYAARDSGKKAIKAPARNRSVDLGGAIGGSASAFENFLQELERQATKIEQGLIPELTLKAQQLAGKEGKDPSRASGAIAAVQSAQEKRFVDDYTLSLKKQTDAEEFRIKLVGLSAHEQELLNIQHKADIDLQQRLADETKKLGPLTADNQAKMAKATQDATDKMIAAANQRYEAERRWETGAKNAVQAYVDSTSPALQANKLWTDSYKGMEDALVNFVKTGKLNFKSLVDSILSDLIRIQVQKSIMPSLSGLMDGALSSISNFMGFRASGGPVSAGGSYIVGEKGPELFTPPSSGSIVPTGGFGGGVQVNIQNNSAADGYMASATSRQNNGQTIIDVVVAKVQQQFATDMRYNGPFRQSIAGTFGLGGA